MSKMSNKTSFLTVGRTEYTSPRAGGDISGDCREPWSDHPFYNLQTSTENALLFGHLDAGWTALLVEF